MKYNLLIAVGASLVGAVSVQGAEDWSEDFTGDVIGMAITAGSVDFMIGTGVSQLLTEKGEWTLLSISG